MRRSPVVPVRAFARGAASVFALVAVTVSCSTDDGRTMATPGAGLDESIAIVTTTVPDDGAGTVLSVAAPWKQGERIDAKYTCDGNNVSPPVTWTGGPVDVSAWAIIMTDTDAPEFAHWTVANIEAGVHGVAEGNVGDLAVIAMNSDAKPDYTGPCPPPGKNHRYSISVYALSQVLEAQTGDPAPALRAAIEAAAIEVATIEFTYSR